MGCHLYSSGFAGAGYEKGIEAPELLAKRAGGGVGETDLAQMTNCRPCCG